MPEKTICAPGGTAYRCGSTREDERGSSAMSMQDKPPAADDGDLTLEGGKMRGRTGIVMAVFAALVAGSIVIVYAFRSADTSPDKAEAGHADGMELRQAENAPAKQESEAVKQKAEPPSEAPKPLDATPSAPLGALPPPPHQEGGAIYDLNRLPPDIKSTLEDIVVAAQSGDIEAMREVLEQNELKPMLSSGPVGDPIAFWKKQSADGEGREILAAMLNVFSAGYAKEGDGKNATYVWPYFAESDLTKLTPSQEVELYRIVPVVEALAMRKSGKYSYYRAAIGSDGVWHYFMK
jgi:hypothetical protein